MSAIQKSLFDYSSLSPEVEREAMASAERVREKVETLREDRRLLEFELAALPMWSPLAREVAEMITSIDSLLAKETVQ